MDIHSSGFTVKVISPYMAEDLISCHNKSFILQQILKKFKFFSGKIDLFFPVMHLMTSYIQIKLVVMQFLVFILTGTSSENCFYSGNKFHHTERLGNVIIRSAFQTFYFVKFAFFCSNHNYRHILYRWHTFQLFQNGIAIISRKHDIQQDQLRYLFFQCFHQFIAISKPPGFKSCCFQCINKKLPDIPLIFYTIDHSALPPLYLSPALSSQVYFFFQYTYFFIPVQVNIRHLLHFFKAKIRPFSLKYLSQILQSARIS